MEGSTRKLSTHVRRHRPMCLRKDAVLERLSSIVILQDSFCVIATTKASKYTKINILLRPKSYDMSQWIVRAPWSLGVPGGPKCCQSSTPITTLANVLQQWTLTNCALSMDTEYVFLMFLVQARKSARIQGVKISELRYPSHVSAQGIPVLEVWTAL